MAKSMECTSDMKLWYGVKYARQLARYHDGKLPKDVIKQILKSYPGSTDGCKCRDCRYHRIVNR